MNEEDVQESAPNLKLKERADKIRRSRLETMGLADQYDLWRESMPEGKMPDNDAYELFLSNQEMEQAAASGKLSVSTGGTELTADTAPPAPDATSDRAGPDEAGDTSEGGGEEPEPPEGMWVPPKETEAENYKAPSTKQMANSKDWVKNARVLYEAMGSPNPTKSKSSDYSYHGGLGHKPDEEVPLSDDEVGQWARNEMSGFNWNVATTMYYAKKIMSSNDPKLAMSFLNMINMYDHSDGGTEDFGGALQEISTDPTTYLGLGVGSVVAKGAAKAMAKTGLKKAIQMSIVGGSAGMMEGGMLGGGFDLTVQNVEQEAGARKNLDYGRAGKATALGAGLGTALGGALGRYTGRKMDIFADAVAEARAMDKARDAILDSRQSGNQEFGRKELVELLEPLSRTSKETGKLDVSEELLNKILTEDGSMPRLDDGSIDYKKINDVIKEFDAKSGTPPAHITEVDELGELGFDVMLGEAEGDLVFSLDGMPNATLERIERLAKKHGIAVDDVLIGNKDGPSDATLSLFSEDPAKTKAFVKDLKAEVQPTNINEPDIKEVQALIDNGDPDGDLARYITDQAVHEEARKLAAEHYFKDSPGEFVITAGDEEFGRAKSLEEADALWKEAAKTSDEVLTSHTSERGDWSPPEAFDLGPESPIKKKGIKTPVRQVPETDSQKLMARLKELEELEKGDVVIRTEGRPGSKVVDGEGKSHELVGRTKNGWYRLRDSIGRDTNLRRKQFKVTEKAPRPKRAGPMELDPFGATAAKIISLNELVMSPEFQLREVKTTHREQAALAVQLRESGIDVSRTKVINEHWTPAELMSLRDVYDHQAHGMAELARKLGSDLKNNGVLTNEQLAMFNNAHSVFVATRDLFYGVSGNAGRQLNILRSKPTRGVYDFNQSLMDSISLQGGRANTERAIKMMADFAGPMIDINKTSTGKAISDLSKKIWGNPYAALLLNVRYNMMLSSWRTHAFNFIGNSVSGLYHHLLVSPFRMTVNNMSYARELAWSVIAPNTKYGPKPDPADRLTHHKYVAEIMGHFSSARESFILAKEIAMGRDIGEGKVWTELGMRYSVINVPKSTTGLVGTSPVRMLEAGDAFFKHQYYNSKLHELAAISARTEDVHGVHTNGKDYEEKYMYYLENPTGPMERQAKLFAAKQTYTNDPNVYGGIFSVVASGVSNMQNRSMLVNMIVPFVRTPANLLNYSMEMIGAHQAMTPSKTYQAIMKGTAEESEEALAKLAIAGGIWLVVADAHSKGEITGTGPSNWEERQVWEAAGWQANSAMINGKLWDISRAAPGGQALATIASVFDFYSMIKQQDKPPIEWIGAGLLYTADMIIDDSYLSTASDVITAISSKESGRIKSATVGAVTSLFVPNFLRDLRRPADETVRSTTSNDPLTHMHKQMMNAMPKFLDVGQGNSEELAPARDWKGDIKNYYGNVYHRGLIPFNVRDPSASDPASMALAYSRIPVSTPNRTIAWPKGGGDSIDLFAMDDGAGFVYDKYLEIMGKRRKQAVNMLLKTGDWKKTVKKGDIGPNSNGDAALREALSKGSIAGRLEMLDFLIKHGGKNNMYTRPGPDGKPKTYYIKHQVSVPEYIRMRKAIRQKGAETDTDKPQYQFKKPIDGPEFFKP